MNHQNLHIVITGAGRGIGEALAKELGGLGSQLSLVDLDLSRWKSLASERFLLEVDLSDPNIAASVLERCEAHHGPIDVLINNAGLQYIGHTASFSDEEEARILNVNFATPLRLMRGAAARMQTRGSGIIVNVSSVIGLIPVPWMIHYSSTKAALGAASESLRLELRGTGVQVLTVYPGSIATEMGHRSKRIYDHPMITRSPEKGPEELARQIRLGMERGKARVLYPPIYRLQWILRGLMTLIIFAFAPRPRGISSRWPADSREEV